ncbi:MAG: GatB/YqeY domain-containing protein [Actinomycetota bacterium]|nr:GatB/YqeY domain-containing protein [Actinomycetota bacterium]
MSELKARLRTDLNAAMKARDEVRLATLRMALTAVTTEEVAGKQSRKLTDDDVTAILVREAKRRREAAEAFDAARRPELADRERAEQAVLDEYLPSQLNDTELAEVVRAAVAQAGATGAQQMGLVMKAAVPVVAGRADGKRLSEEVRRQLGLPR